MQKWNSLGQKIPQLWVLSWSFKIVIFEIGANEFVILQTLVKNIKILIFSNRTFNELLSYLKSTPSNYPNNKLWRKNENSQIWDQKCLTWVFLGRTFKNYCHIWNQHHRVFLKAKFRAKMKILKNLESKMPNLGVLSSSFENYFHIWNQDPGVCTNAKFLTKIKIFKFGTKNVWYFWIGIWKCYCHIWNQRPQILKTWVFNW